ncbi:MAG: Dabb family protein [Devosia sp.]|nr:Dabb family protein [Devosia sp.]
MIRHCVFVRFKPMVLRAERDAIYADLAALKTKLRGMLALHSGGNVNPEGLAKGFDEGFFIDFQDAPARDAYLEHPEHQLIGARIGAAAEHGTDGIFVFDFELPDR